MWRERAAVIESRIWKAAVTVGPANFPGIVGSKVRAARPPCGAQPCIRQRFQWQNRPRFPFPRFPRSVAFEKHRSGSNYAVKILPVQIAAEFPSRLGWPNTE